jgi:prevent-host-death family protein
MKMKEDVKPISYIKSHTADILKQVNSNHRPIFITQKGLAKAVIIDTDSYENLINAISILKILNESEQEIKNNNFISHEEFKKEMDQKMKNLAK